MCASMKAVSLPPRKCFCSNFHSIFHSVFKQNSLIFHSIFLHDSCQCSSMIAVSVSILFSIPYSIPYISSKKAVSVLPRKLVCVQESSQCASKIAVSVSSPFFIVSSTPFSVPFRFPLVFCSTYWSRLPFSNNPFWQHCSIRRQHHVSW